MATRMRPGEQGGWQVTLGQGAASFTRGAFDDRAAAEDWAARAALAVKQCTIRIGSKRFLGTAAEALQRWAIDQGTLPRAEGGTQLAPARRLAPLMAEAACSWPLALLLPEDLAAMRHSRLTALGTMAGCIAEQAALAAALEQFRDFHLPALDDPFAEPAPDGIYLLDEAASVAIQDQAGAMGGAWPRLVGLMLEGGAPLGDLLPACCGQADRAAGSLHLSGGRRVASPEEWLPTPDAAADAPLLPGLGPEAVEAGLAVMGCRLGQPGLRPEAFQLTALTRALGQGQHLDEILMAAGAAEPMRG